MDRMPRVSDTLDGRTCVTATPPASNAPRSRTNWPVASRTLKSGSRPRPLKVKGPLMRANCRLPVMLSIRNASPSIDRRAASSRTCPSSGVPTVPSSTATETRRSSGRVVALTMACSRPVAGTGSSTPKAAAARATSCTVPWYRADSTPLPRPACEPDTDTRLSPRVASRPSTETTAGVHVTRAGARSATDTPLTCASRRCTCSSAVAASGSSHTPLPRASNDTSPVRALGRASTSGAMRPSDRRFARSAPV